LIPTPHAGGSSAAVNRLFDFFIEDFKRKHGGKDPSNDKNVIRRIRKLSEDLIQKHLSVMKNNFWSFKLGKLFEGIDFATSISRARLESMLSEMSYELLAMVHGRLLRVEMAFGDFRPVKKTHKSLVAGATAGAVDAARGGGGNVDANTTDSNDDGNNDDDGDEAPEVAVGEGDGDGRCIVCWEDAPRLLLLPCRHVCVCVACLPHLDRKCPMCRREIVKAISQDA
jgi:hypothetical protein